MRKTHTSQPLQKKRTDKMDNRLGRHQLNFECINQPSFVKKKRYKDNKQLK